MLWSILISGIPERFHSVQPLLYSILETQGVARRPDVELIYLLDNRRRTVGAKRNALLDAAAGEYVSFIDDDDEVSPEYVSRILRAIVQTRQSAAPADVICFRQDAHLEPHGIVHECHYSLAHFRDRKPEERRRLEPLLDGSGQPAPNALKWTGPPAHTMVWRRALLDGIRFPDQQFGEDVSWVDAVCAKALREIVMDGNALYHYRFNAATTATR